MTKKKQNIIKNLTSGLNLSSGSIRPLKFKLVHFVVLMSVGLLLAVASALTLASAYVPLSWERVAGTVSSVSQNEAASGEPRYVAEVTYSLSGDRFTTREEFVGERPSMNDSQTVYYNPNNPGESMVQRSGAFSFLAWIPLLIGLGLIVIASLQIYMAWRRTNRIKLLTTTGVKIPSEVIETEVLKNKTFLQKTFYRRYIFFKLIATPVGVDSENTMRYESELLMWRSKMYGDVDTLKDSKTEVSVYADSKSAKQYYLEPPVLEYDSIESPEVVMESPAPVAVQASVADVDTSMSGGESVDRKADSSYVTPSLKQISVDDSTPSVDSTAQADSISTTPVVDAASSQEKIIDDGLAVSDINELEKSLASINTPTPTIDLNFDEADKAESMPVPSPAPVAMSEPVSATAPPSAAQATSVGPQVSSPSPTSPSATDLTPPAPSPTPTITGISSPVNPAQPAAAASAPAVSQVQGANPGMIVKPVTNISQSINDTDPITSEGHMASLPQSPMQTAAPISVVTPSPIATPTPVLNTVRPEPSPAPTPALTPAPTPAPVLSREEVANASRSGRTISVPRR